MANTGNEKMGASGAANGESQETPAGPPQFSTNLKTKTVTINDEPYTLTELDGDADDGLTDERVRRFRLVDGKPVGVTTSRGLKSKLIAMCLKDRNGNAVEQDVIQKWSTSTRDALYEMCEELNRHTKASQNAAKN